MAPSWAWRLALAVALLVSLWTSHLRAPELPGLRVLEATVWDGWTRALADDREDPRLAIVDIDEESLRRLGPWPWPRNRIAELAERLLSEAGAARVVLDLVMPHPAEGDARLAAMAREGMLVLGQALDYEARPAAVGVGVAAGGRSAPQPVVPSVAATGFVGNHAQLAGARCVGNIGIKPDFDGNTRWLAPWSQWEGQHYPSLAWAALECAGVTQWPQPPVDERGWWRVPFQHRPWAHLAVPAHEVLAGTVDANGSVPLLAGRIVLVGSSALGLADRVATPVAPNVSGVSVHAEALSWLMSASEGRAPVPPPGASMLILGLGSSLLLAWVVVRRESGLVHLGLALLSVAAVWAWVAIWAVRAGSPQPLSTPLVGWTLVLLVLLPAEWAGTQGRLRRQSRLLARYVSPAVLQELQRESSGDVLAPRRAQITVLIADMQDYTRNTADAGLNEAARLTKEFLQALTAPVLEARGTLDRYTGDGLVAFWGAPIPDAEHADRAVGAALGILEAVDAFNAARRGRGLEPVRVRMGLASGEALVGDLGTPFRIAYTAVGDCINLASRLQQASREVGVSVLASHSVTQACRHHRFHDLGLLAIRGLQEQRVATPADPRGTRSPAAVAPAHG